MMHQSTTRVHPGQQRKAGGPAERNAPRAGPHPAGQSAPVTVAAVIDRVLPPGDNPGVLEACRATGEQ